MRDQVSHYALIFLILGDIFRIDSNLGANVDGQINAQEQEVGHSTSPSVVLDGPVTVWVVIAIDIVL